MFFFLIWDVHCFYQIVKSSESLKLCANFVYLPIVLSMQGEMQQLRDKLVSAEKTAKNESQLKVCCLTSICWMYMECCNRSGNLIFYLVQEKLQLRLKVLEEGLQSGNGTVRRPVVEAKRSSSVTTNGSARRTTSGSEEGSRLLANGSRTRRSAVAQLRSSMSSSTLLKNGRMTSSFDGGRSTDGGASPKAKPFTNGFEELRTGRKSSTEVSKSSGPPSPKSSRPASPKISGSASSQYSVPASPKKSGPASSQISAPASPESEKASEVAKEKAESTAPAADSEIDTVSGVLYDMLQKEVINLRKAMHEKDQSLKDKDDAIEVCHVISMFVVLIGYVLV